MLYILWNNFWFQEANFAVPLAPAPKRHIRHAIYSKDKQITTSSTRSATSCNETDSKSTSLLETAALENATVLHSKSVSFEPSGICLWTRMTSQQSCPPSISARHNGQESTLAAQSTQDVPAPASPRVPLLNVLNNWDARVVRTLITAGTSASCASSSCASASCDSLENDSASRGLLLVRGRYVRQRDVRALLAPRVHPALLDSVLTVVLPLHAPTSSLVKLAASGDVSLIGANEDPTEPLVLLADLLSALRAISPQLGLQF